MEPRKTKRRKSEKREKKHSTPSSFLRPPRKLSSFNLFLSFFSLDGALFFDLSAFCLQNTPLRSRKEGKGKNQSSKKRTRHLFLFICFFVSFSLTFFLIFVFHVSVSAALRLLENSNHLKKRQTGPPKQRRRGPLSRNEIRERGGAQRKKFLPKKKNTSEPFFSPSLSFSFFSLPLISPVLFLRSLSLSILSLPPRKEQKAKATKQYEKRNKEEKGDKTPLSFLSLFS